MGRIARRERSTSPMKIECLSGMLFALVSTADLFTSKPKQILAVIFSFSKLSEFFKCLYLNKKMHEIRNRQVLLNSYIDPTLDRKNAREFFDKEEIGIDEFSQIVETVLEKVAANLEGSWGCWREAENVFTWIVVHPDHGCDFLKIKILQDDSIKCDTKHFTEENRVLAHRFCRPKQWGFDKDIKNKAVLFIVSKNSKPKEKILATVITFLLDKYSESSMNAIGLEY